MNHEDKVFKNINFKSDEPILISSNRNLRKDINMNISPKTEIILDDLEKDNIDYY